MQLAEGIDRDRLWRAVLITLAAVAAYHAASYILLPGMGLPPDLLTYTGGRSRLSVMALGMVPWLSALLLFEFTALLVPQRMSHGFTVRGHADAFARPVLVLALIFAAFQAWGVSAAILNLPQFAGDYSTTTHVAMIAAMTTGTAFAMALGHIINRAGIGHGFWVLLAAAFVPQLAQGLMLNAMAARQGAIGSDAVAISLGMMAAVAAGTVAMLEARNRSEFQSALPVVMPNLLAGILAGWVMVLPLVLPVEGRPVFHLRPGGLAQGVITAAIAAGILWFYARREGSGTLFVPTAALITAALVGDYIALNAFGLIAFISLGTLMIVVAVFHSVLRSYYPVAAITDDAGATQ